MLGYHLVAVIRLAGNQFDIYFDSEIFANPENVFITIKASSFSYSVMFYMVVIYIFNRFIMFLKG